MSKLKINSLNDLKELKNVNWNNPYTERQFILSNAEQVDYLIRNYNKNIAYGFDYKNSDFTIMKENNIFFIRDDNKHENEKYYGELSPVTTLYDIKSENIEDIINYALV